MGSVVLEGEEGEKEEEEEEDSLSFWVGSLEITWSEGSCKNQGQGNPS